MAQLVVVSKRAAPIELSAGANDAAFNTQLSIYFYIHIHIGQITNIVKHIGLFKSIDLVRTSDGTRALKARAKPG